MMRIDEELTRVACSLQLQSAEHAGQASINRDLAWLLERRAELHEHGQDGRTAQAVLRRWMIMKDDVGAVPREVARLRSVARLHQAQASLAHSSMRFMLDGWDEPTCARCGAALSAEVPCCLACTEDLLREVAPPR